MTYKVLNYLPKSHRWQTISVDGQNLKGIVWNKEDIKEHGTIFVYKHWASVHFDSDWYEIAAGSVADDDATSRDIALIKSLLGEKLNSKSQLIDVNCGTGRHLFKLAEEKIFGIGMEGASLLRKIGKEKAKKSSVPLEIVSTSKYYRRKYHESADIVTSLFNSMGYTFNMDDDIERLQWMVDLLKPRGYFLLDIRAEDFQKRHYAQQTTIKERIYLPNSSEKTQVEITTVKYWKDKALTAEEEIIISDNSKTLAQHTTYGWKTYSLDELNLMLQKIGLVLRKHQLDYYSSPKNLGERIFLLSQKVD